MGKFDALWTALAMRLAELIFAWLIEQFEKDPVALGDKVGQAVKGYKARIVA